MNTESKWALLIHPVPWGLSRCQTRTEWQVAFPPLSWRAVLSAPRPSLEVERRWPLVCRSWLWATLPCLLRMGWRKRAVRGWGSRAALMTPWSRTTNGPGGALWVGQAAVRTALKSRFCKPPHLIVHDSHSECVRLPADTSPSSPRRMKSSRPLLQWSGGGGQTARGEGPYEPPGLCIHPWKVCFNATFSCESISELDSTDIMAQTLMVC